MSRRPVGIGGFGGFVGIVGFVGIGTHKKNRLTQGETVIP